MSRIRTKARPVTELFEVTMRAVREMYDLEHDECLMNMNIKALAALASTLLSLGCTDWGVSDGEYLIKGEVKNMLLPVYGRSI